jgi:alkaline phosphatase
MKLFQAELWESSLAHDWSSVYNEVYIYTTGARIEHGHHDNLAKKALYETLTFEDAIIDALRMTNQEETLVIVTADHSHVFDNAGYAYRGTNIFGKQTTEKL